jgi:hypothetical protein
VIENIHKNHNQPEKDIKPQLELLRTLMPRLTADVQQIDIITNYLVDKLVKERDTYQKSEVLTTTTRMRKFIMIFAIDMYM